MRSSSGVHFVALDHVRALAAFVVFSWHFLHGRDGYPVPFDGVPAVLPLALLDEGHTGVALFMTLSGYLFARLLDGKAIDHRAFLYNRCLRLAPLLVIVIAIAGLVRWAAGDSLVRYAGEIAAGLVAPTWPNGGWSIAIELHFYAILPILLLAQRRSLWLLLAILAAALVLRMLIHAIHGEVQLLAYWTIFGRIDQFLFGMLAQRFRHRLAGRHVAAGAIALPFLLFYAWFDHLGGFYRMDGYPSPSTLWIVLPTLEGFAYAFLIAWYDASFAPAAHGWSGFVARIGSYSYSIYLLHFFFVFGMARFVHEKIMDISNFYPACAWALLGFGVMIPVGYLSFRVVEMPFLRLRRPYLRQEDTANGQVAVARV